MPYFRRLLRLGLNAACDSRLSFFCLCVAVLANAVVNMPSLGNIVSLPVTRPVASFSLALSFCFLFHILISSLSLCSPDHCVEALLLKLHCFVVDVSCSSGRLCRQFSAAGQHRHLTLPEQFQFQISSIIDCTVPYAFVEPYYCSPFAPSSLLRQNGTLSLTGTRDQDSY